MSHDWKAYYKKIGNQEPRPLLVKALIQCKEKETALDIGAGSLGDSFYLLEQGFNEVVAVDSSTAFLEIIKDIHSESLKTFTIPIEEYIFPENYFNIVNAEYTLPFIRKEKLDMVIHSIYFSLKSGGVFCGQFFGDRDSWNTQESSMIFHTQQEIEKILAPFKVLTCEEEELDGVTAAGIQKHWHVFHVILKKV